VDWIHLAQEKQRHNFANNTGECGIKLIMGIRNFNLQRSQFRKIGKISCFSFFCLHTTKIIV